VKQWWPCVAIVSVLSVACGGNAQHADHAEVRASADGAGTGGLLERVAVAVGVPQYRDVTIPAGTPLRLELSSAVASDSSQVEDAVRAELWQPIAIDGHDVLPAGTNVSGRVTAVQGPGGVEGRARVAFRFDSLSAGAEEYVIDTAAITRQAEGTNGENATKIALGAGADITTRLTVPLVVRVRVS
jgi:hypothetical protein